MSKKTLTAGLLLLLSLLVVGSSAIQGVEKRKYDQYGNCLLACDANSLCNCFPIPQ